MTQAELNRIIDSATKTMVKTDYDEGWNDALNHLEDLIGDLHGNDGLGAGGSMEP